MELLLGQARVHDAMNDIEQGVKLYKQVRSSLGCPLIPALAYALLYICSALWSKVGCFPDPFKGGCAYLGWPTPVTILPLGWLANWCHNSMNALWYNTSILCLECSLHGAVMAVF